MPKVSIITATFNNARFLKETIDSVFAQVHQDWEWIIVDNGSTDETPEILAKVRDQRVQAVRLENNLGVGEGRNLGLQLMSGNFFCFLDGDDVLPAQSLKARLKIFESDSGISFVDGAVRIMDHKLERETGRYVPGFRGNPLKPLLRLSNACFVGNTWMIKRKTGVDYRFKPGLTHGEELLFYIQIAGNGLYDYTTEPVLEYRRHPHSAMTDLKGIEKGYKAIVDELSKTPSIHKEQVQTFATKAKQIMWKSYLKKFRPMDSLRVLFENWIN